MRPYYFEPLKVDELHELHQMGMASWNVRRVSRAMRLAMPQVPSRRLFVRPVLTRRGVAESERVNGIILCILWHRGI